MARRFYSTAPAGSGDQLPDRHGRHTGSTHDSPRQATGTEPAGTGGEGSAPRPPASRTSPYTEEQALALVGLTARFYQENADSFGSTRQRPWDGWERLADMLERIWKIAGNRSADGSTGDGTSTVDAGPIRWPEALSDSQIQDPSPDGGEDFSSSPTHDLDDGTDVPAVRRRILDLGCGNMRFERFLEERFPSEPFELECIDGCPELAGFGGTPSDSPDGMDGTGSSTFFMEADIIGALVRGAIPPLGAGEHDLSVAFGFMHHIPGEATRIEAMRELSESTGKGGIFAVSLWRFADDPKTRRKARRKTAGAIDELSDLPGFEDLELAPGDYLLGWQDRPGVYRYCHSFDDAEIERMVSALEPAAWLIDRYRADGRGGRANEYLVFARI